MTMATTNGNTVVRTTTLAAKEDPAPAAPSAPAADGAELAPPPAEGKPKRGRKAKAPAAAAPPSDTALAAVGRITIQATKVGMSPVAYVQDIETLAEDLEKFGFAQFATAIRADIAAWQNAWKSFGAEPELKVDPKG